jgi:hypothetical protein
MARTKPWWYAGAVRGAAPLSLTEKISEIEDAPRFKFSILRVFLMIVDCR